MSTEVMYQCDKCGQGYTTTVRADRLDACRVKKCKGTPKRCWKFVSFNRVPGGGRDG